MDIVVIINMIIANIIIMFIITTMAVSPFNKDCFLVALSRRFKNPVCHIFRMKVHDWSQSLFVNHKIADYTFRTFTLRIFIFGDTYGQFVCLLRIQFRVQYIQPGKIEPLAPFGKCIQFAEFLAVNAVFDDS